MQLSLSQPSLAGQRVATQKRSVHRPRASRLQVQAVVETDTSITPVRFIVRQDKLTDWGLAAMGVLPRGTLGLAAVGYKFSFEKDEDPSAYAVLRSSGWKFVEYSDAALLPRPKKPLEIFEFQGCPFCKKVREVVDYYNIDVVYYPCPQSGPTWRPMAIEEGGKKQFPYMRDPNKAGTAMYESNDIIKYIADNYGDGKPPGGPLTAALCGISLIPRMGKGSKYTPSKVTRDTQPLEVWAYESSPFCKIVREVLCELEIPHIHRSMSRGSPKRQEFFEKYGLFQVPYMEDPNTGKKLFESAEIIDYLRATYTA